MSASAAHENRLSGRHFLIQASEVELICSAIRRLASGPLADATIAAIRADRRAAEASGPGGTTFRFRAPAEAEHLMTLAAIRARRNAAEPLAVHRAIG
jgi:hypothetical protein